MVATRNHPQEFETPAPEPVVKASPTKRSTRGSSANPTKPATGTVSTQSESKPRTSLSSTSALAASIPESLAKPRASASSLQPRSRPSSSLSAAPSRASGGWSHTPSNLTLIWLAISIPLTIWDTGYVLLRPLSMPGGALHKPLWTPYELYGKVDYVYGWKAYNEGFGWTAAQGWVNALEIVAYVVYLYLVYAYGQQEAAQGTGAPKKEVMGSLKALSESRTVHGRTASVVVLLGYSTASLTFWKTVLYWLVEAMSGFGYVRHNDLTTLIFLYIMPSGAWIVFPLYMMYVFGKEILQGLDTSADDSRKER